MRSALVAVALLGAALLGLRAAPPAGAVEPGEYEVFPCRGHGQTSIFANTTPDVSTLSAHELCTVERAAVTLEGPAGTTKFGESARWGISTPPFAEIKHVQMVQEFSGPWGLGGGLEWSVSTGTDESPQSRRLIEQAGHLATSDTVPPAGLLEYKVGAFGQKRAFPAGVHFFEVKIECAVKTSNCPTQPVSTTTAGLAVELADPTPPIFESSTGALLEPGTVHGRSEVTDEGFDEQSGVFVSKVSIDGDLIATAGPDKTNGGLCRRPFEVFVPCPESSTFHITVPTEEVQDGTHIVRISICDATETNCSEGPPTSITVANTPINTSKPSITGNARVGSELTASPGGWRDFAPGTLGLQWLSCPANVVDPGGQCKVIPGATGSTYTPTAADRGRRISVRVRDTVLGAGQASSDAFSAPSAEVPGAKRRVEIVKHPRARTNVALAKFRFSSDPTGLRFQCKLDKGPFRTCRAAFEVRVKPGLHVLRVRAVNGAKAVGPSQASFHWRFTPKRQRRRR